MFALSEHQVHLWVVRPEECQDPLLLAEYRRLLDQEEMAEWHRYRVEKKKLEHLISRALLRTTLSQYAPIAPQKWQLVRSPTGKPAIDWPTVEPLLADGPTETPRLEFNLSHTEGLIICAVTSGAPLGVDVEDTGPSAEYLCLARRFFHPAETALLEALAPDQLPLAFYRLWTLKEAYLKALGTGLTSSLDTFSFGWPNETLAHPCSFPIPSPSQALPLNLPPQNAPQLLIFSPRPTDNPPSCQFREFLLDGRFQVALAVARPPQSPLEITLHHTIPLLKRR